jgi:hypothetical protein
MGFVGTFVSIRLSVVMVPRIKEALSMDRQDRWRAVGVSSARRQLSSVEVRMKQPLFIKLAVEDGVPGDRTDRNLVERYESEGLSELQSVTGGGCFGEASQM